MVSVSRRAAAPHLGQATFTNSGTLPSGEPPASVICTFSGSSTGRSFSGTGTMPQLGAINHRDRRAPVALPADAPIFQAEGHGGFAEIFLLGKLRHLFDRLLGRHAAVLAGVHQQAVFFDEGQDRLIRLTVSRIALAPRINNHLDVQVILLRELVIALVVRRHRHDGARAVVEQHVVGHPDGHLLVVERIQRVAPVKTPCFSMAPMSPASFALRCSLIRSSTLASRSGLLAIRSVTTGCSGASCNDVAP